jgi:hypothetical protein
MAIGDDADEILGQRHSLIKTPRELTLLSGI